MAKKVKRQVSPSEAPVAVVRSTSSTSSYMGPSSTDFNPDYSYVIKDLKRIGILAGTFVAILVVLSFFLQ